jgi:hypothetical protein
MNNENKILVCIWGATMRMVDFWQIIKETDKTMLVRELQQKQVEETGFLRGKVIPTLEFEQEKDYKTNIEEGQSRPLKNIELRLYKKNDIIFSNKNGFKKYFEIWNGQPVEYDHCD